MNTRTGSLSGATQSDSKTRIERNREAARASRKRKAEHYANVEKRCAQLEKENAVLKSQLKADEDAKDMEDQDKLRVCVELEEMVIAGASNEDIKRKIHVFKEEHADYGNGRQSALDYHLCELERLLLPTQVTKMCMWVLQQDDGFWNSNNTSESDNGISSSSSVLDILRQELGVDEAQKAKFNAYRDRIRLLCTELHNSLGLLNKLKDQVRSKNDSLNLEMEQIQSILTPMQIAKFIVWVTNNPACVHMLNQLWDNVVS